MDQQGIKHKKFENKLEKLPPSKEVLREFVQALPGMILRIRVKNGVKSGKSCCRCWRVLVAVLKVIAAAVLVAGVWSIYKIKVDTHKNVGVYFFHSIMNLERM